MSNGIQVAISREHKREVLGQKVAKGDVSRSIRIYIGSLVKQINSDALAVEDKNALPKDA